MNYTTLLLSGVPQKVPLADLSYCLDRLFCADDEIGTFTLRNLPNDGRKRQIALDFRSGLDAIAAQARLDSYHYKVPDGGEYTLRAKITWKEEFMRQHTRSEPWQELVSEKVAQQPWTGMALVPTVSDGAMYRANAKLDAQLQLLKKQELILQTERKVLKQKMKLKKKYASMCESNSYDGPTTSKRRRKSCYAGATQDLQIRSSRPKDQMPELKALMSVEKKSKRQKDPRSRSKARSPESSDKDLNIKRLKRSVGDHQSKSQEWSPRARRSSNIKDLKSNVRESGSLISRSREKDPTREEFRPLAIMPKSPPIISSPLSTRTRRVSLTTTSQSKEATIANYNWDANLTVFVDVIPKQQVNGKNKTDYDSNHDKITESSSSSVLVSEYINTKAGSEAPVEHKKNKMEKETSAIEEKATPSKELNENKEKATTSIDLVSKYANMKVGSEAAVENKKYKIQKETSAIEEKATPSKELNANNEKAITSKDLVSKYANMKVGSVAPVENKKNKMQKETSTIEEKATHTKKLSTIKKKAITSKDLVSKYANMKVGSEAPVENKKNKMQKETSTIEEKATHSKKLSTIKEKAITSKDLVSKYGNIKVGPEESVNNKKNKIQKETNTIEEKATPSKELNANKEKAITSKDLVSKYGNIKVGPEESVNNKKNKIQKETSTIEEKATPSKELNANKEKAITSKDLVSKYANMKVGSVAPVENKKNKMQKETSTIEEKATHCKKLSAIKEKAITSKDLVSKYGNIKVGSEASVKNKKNKMQKETSTIEEKATYSKELNANKEKAITSKDLVSKYGNMKVGSEAPVENKKNKMQKETSTIEEKATHSIKLSAIKEKAITSNVPVSKYSRTKAGSETLVDNKMHKELNGNKEKATPSKVLVSKYARTKAGSETPVSNNMHEELNANKEKATPSKVLVSKKYACTKAGSKTPLINKMHIELNVNKEKPTPSKVLGRTPDKNKKKKKVNANKVTGTPSKLLESKCAHTKVASETPNKVNEWIRNIGNEIMCLMHNMLEEISLKEQRPLSENEKALIDGILSARVLNRIEPLVAVKNVTAKQVVLNYRELYSKEEDTLLISKILDGVPKETFETAERGDGASLTGLGSESSLDLRVEPPNNAERGDSAATALVSEDFRAIFVKSKYDDPSAEVMDNIEKNTVSEETPTPGCPDPELTSISLKWPEIKSVSEKINEQFIDPPQQKVYNNVTVTEIIDLDNIDSERKKKVERNTYDLTEIEVIEIEDTETATKKVCIKDEIKPFKAKEKLVSKPVALTDITFDKDLCPIPARPQFVLVLKRLLKQMKNTINTAEMKGLRKFPMNMFKSVLRTMLRKLLAGKGYLGTHEIVNLFRAEYPKERDYILVKQVVEDVKMGKYEKYNDSGQPEDKDDVDDDVILVENKYDIVTVLDSDDDVDQISDKPNLDDVKPIEGKLQSIQHDEAEQTLKSRYQGNIVKAESNDYPTTVGEEKPQINNVIKSNDKIPEAQVNGSNFSATPVAELSSLAYLTINGTDRENANETNSSEFGNRTEGPIETIKEEIEPEFTEAAVESLLDSLKNFDGINDVNDTEKETPRVTAITIMTSFSELISLKNEMNQSSDKVANESTDKEVSEIKIENDVISPSIEKECVHGNRQYGYECFPTNYKGRDNNVKKNANDKNGVNDVRNNNDHYKIITESEVGKLDKESGPVLIDRYVARTTNVKTASREDEEESIESITKYMDSIHTEICGPTEGPNTKN